MTLVEELLERLPPPRPRTLRSGLVEKVILGALARGHNQTVAAKAAGVSLASLQRWRAGDPAFADAIRSATAQGRGAHQLGIPYGETDEQH